MSTLIDHRYIALISPKLSLFKKKTDRLYNCRCPICGDSRKNKIKARGYILEHKGSFLYKCHNCNISLSLDKLIENIDPNLQRAYRLDKFRERGNAYQSNTETFLIRDEVKEEVELNEFGLVALSKLPSSHPAVSYINSRKIPERYYGELFFVPNMKELEKFSPMYEGKLSNESRIAIPYYNKKAELVGLSCRAMGNSSLRYLTVRKTNDPLIYGIQNVDLGKTIYVIEGPFDSMFVENAIAPGGTDFLKAVNMIPKENAVLVFDNQPRNVEVVKRMEKMISYGYRMVIWPSSWNFKDINEAIISGLDSNDVLSVLNSNSHKGLSLKLAIRGWKRV
jgi:hypothetical protein